MDIQKAIRPAITKLSLALFLLFAIFLAFVQSQRTSVFPYNVKQNYVYDFLNTDALKLDLYLTEEKLSLNGLREKWDTAFVKIEVDATFFGKFLEPKIELNSNGLTYIQYFEYGASGTRYLNISGFISSQPCEILFDGIHMSIPDQKVQLFLFDNSVKIEDSVMIFSPHPDDAEIAAYGFYSDNNDAYIVTITAGDAGEKKYDEIYQLDVEHYKKKGKLRVWNSITVPLLGGISPQRTVNLGYFDDTLHEMYSIQPAVVESRFTETSDINSYRNQNISNLISGVDGIANWESLVNDIRYLLDRIRPDILIIPYPAIDDHEDHKYSAIAVFEAIRDSKLETGRIFLYFNHYVLNKYYPHGDIGSSVTLPPNFGRSIFFRSILSHPLSEARQRDKLLALEAMNDLRLDTEWQTSYGSIKHAVITIGKSILGMDYSFFRKAVRAEELFFVVNVEDVWNEDLREELIGGVGYSERFEKEEGY